MIVRPLATAALSALAMVLFFVPPARAALRVSAFQADATPALGEPLIWVDPAARVADPLFAKGIVLDDGKNRYVLCSVDWCGIGSSVHARFREKIAAAARTSPSHVAVHSVHQHTAPYIDGGGRKLMRSAQPPLTVMSDGFLQQVTDRIARAVREAAETLQPFDNVGTSEAVVERVASARRIIMPDRGLLIRFSGSGSNPEMAALPEGPIDPHIRLITLAKGDKPLVRLFFYASHPQTYCCDGTVSADIVGKARAAIESADGVPTVYFTGGAGDVTVGKYNDGSPEVRDKLAGRLLQGMRDASRAVKYRAARDLTWRSAPLELPARPADAARQILADARRSPTDRYKAAITVAFAEDRPALNVNLLEIGEAAAVFLPGEPMLEFQKYSQDMRPGRFVAFSGYGDISTGYLCTDQAYEQGGYEPSASNTQPGAEAAIKAAIRSILAK